MMNLSDFLANAPGGAAMEALARQYQLSPEQADAAVEALLPAFSVALKQLASSPGGMMRLFNLMAQANYQAMLENPTYAFGPKGMQAGNDLVVAMFGSHGMNRAIADQAAQFAGVGSTILQQMLPAVASLLMGGLSRSVTQLASATSDTGARGAGEPTGAGPVDSADIQGNRVRTRVGSTLGPQTPAGATPPSQSETSPPSPREPGQTTDDKKSGRRADQYTAIAKQLEQAGAEGKAFWGQMFETGREIQKVQIDGMQRLFDAWFDRERRR